MFDFKKCQMLHPEEKIKKNMFLIMFGLIFGCWEKVLGRFGGHAWDIYWKLLGRFLARCLVGFCDMFGTFVEGIREVF